jgi:hypothetical protein
MESVPHKVHWRVMSHWRVRRYGCLVSAMLLPAFTQASAQPRHAYAWRDAVPAVGESLSERIAPPTGFERETLQPDSFGAWLRGLPLRPGRPPVRLYDGRLKNRQDVHVAVVDIDVGARDLQQCADAVLRLRAEWLYATAQRDAIRFRLTSGDALPWRRWASGERPRVRGRQILWSHDAPADASHASFRRYLDTLFTYAGTLSLERETQAVPVSELRSGDIFVKGGSPGHAVIVLDTAHDRKDGRRAFLLAQSYMPAQEIHVLRDPERPQFDPWYPADFGDTLVTPEWTFARRQLRRFRESAPDRANRQE